MVKPTLRVLAGHSGHRLVQGNQAEVYVARFDETVAGATLSWAQQAGSTSHDYVFSLNLFGNRLYVQGLAQHAAPFGTFTLPKSSSYLVTLSPEAPLAVFTRYPKPAHAHLERFSGSCTVFGARSSNALVERSWLSGLQVAPGDFVQRRRGVN